MYISKTITHDTIEGAALIQLIQSGSLPLDNYKTIAYDDRFPLTIRQMAAKEMINALSLIGEDMLRYAATVTPYTCDRLSQLAHEQLVPEGLPY